MLPLLPLPPSLNHRALGERGTERLLPATRPVISATQRAGFPAAPPRPAPPARPRLLSGWGHPRHHPRYPPLWHVYSCFRSFCSFAAARPPTSESALADPSQVRFNALTAFWGVGRFKGFPVTPHLSNQSVALSAPGAQFLSRLSWDGKAQEVWCLPSR